MKTSVKEDHEVSECIKLFNYDHIITIKHLMKMCNVTQQEISDALLIDERNGRRYFSSKTKLSKHFLVVFCTVLELPFQVSLELFKNAGLELTMLYDGPSYLNYLKEIRTHNLQTNLEIIAENNL